MPTLMACILAAVASLCVEMLVQPYVTVRVKAMMQLVVFLAVAYATRRQLVRLRDGGD
jgi:hypothetical protein